MLTHPIHQAARAGDLDQLRHLLDEGVAVDLPAENDGHTPLMVACLSDHAGVGTVRLLLERGADVHACVQPRPVNHTALVGMLDDEALDPDLKAMLEGVRGMLDHQPEATSLISMAVKEAGLEKIRALFDHGADPGCRSAHGYTLLTDAACADRLDVIDLLLDFGAPLDGESSWGESALANLSRNGRFGEVGKLLARGADPGPLGWTPLLRATALGSVAEVRELLDAGAELEATDRWGRTAFLLSVHAGDVEMANLLLERGANRAACGRCGRTPMSYAVARDDISMLRWLLDHGFDLEQADEFGHTPLMEAASHGAVGCFRLLTDAGADWARVDRHGEGLVAKTTHPQIIRLLVERGEDISGLDAGALRQFIGIGTCDGLPVSEQEYLDGRFRKFGKSNPERMQVPFWQAMVRCGWDAYRAADQFGDSSFGRENPVWCHQRFGMSLTELPDGRWVQVAGEHEDHYDPDFCIYNDVVIHDGRGGLEILGYPEDVFPPTDFHSATYLAPWIYLIGNLGYPARRGAVTPVYRLHTETWAIEPVTVAGSSPGWIHRHRAEVVSGGIRISGGKVLKDRCDGSAEIVGQRGTWMLDLTELCWRRLGDE